MTSPTESATAEAGARDTTVTGATGRTVWRRYRLVLLVLVVIALGAAVI